jgi:hypothetical protein
MKNLRKSALAFVIAYAVTGSAIPVSAQATAKFETLEDVATSRSKIADVDIVTDSPTLQNPISVQQGQVNVYSGYGAGAYPNSNPTLYNPPPSTSTSQPGPQSGGQQTLASPSVAAAAPVQIDSQTVGRVVGVAGTALLLGAFLKNGGVGGMMNTLGLDNRFHGRGPSLSGY